MLLTNTLSPQNPPVPTCDVCGEENIGVAYHCSTCPYDECEACHAKLSAATATKSAKLPGITAEVANPSKTAAPASVTCLPILLLTIGTLAVLTFLETFGLVRVTESIFRHEPHRINEGSIVSKSQPKETQPVLPYYEATPDRVWQTTGLAPGTSRRGIIFLVSNSTKERKRAAQDFPPGSQVLLLAQAHAMSRLCHLLRALMQGLAGPDGFYVQHLYWSLKHAEENLLVHTHHPDVLILYAEDGMSTFLAGTLSEGGPCTLHSSIQSMGLRWHVRLQS